MDLVKDRVVWLFGEYFQWYASSRRLSFSFKEGDAALVQGSQTQQQGYLILRECSGSVVSI